MNQKKNWCRVAATVLFFAGLQGCKTDAERVQETCLKRREQLNSLYATYGGSNLANDVGKEAEASRKGKDSGLLSGLANVVSDVDRSTFESDCRRLGSGQQTTFLTNKGREFFSKPETAKACEDIVALEGKAIALNEKLPEASKVVCYPVDGARNP